MAIAFRHPAIDLQNTSQVFSMLVTPRTVCMSDCTLCDDLI